MNYRITSGYFIMNKRFFSKESLRPGSYLRQMLGMEGQWSKKIKGIRREDDRVIVEYNRDDVVYLADDLHNFIRKMKEAYKDQIEGKITVSKLRGMVDFLEMTVEF